MLTVWPYRDTLCAVEENSDILQDEMLENLFLLSLFFETLSHVVQADLRLTV